MGYRFRRISYVFLCAFPVVALAFGSVRALRVTGVYQTIGAVLFVLISIAAWVVGARVTRSAAEVEQRLALAGVFLLVPFALVALLWVGLGPPWIATPAENLMRYVVLLASSLCVSAGFIVLKDALSEAGERIYSTLGFAAAIFGGSAYLVWVTAELGAHVAEVRDGQMPTAIVSLGDVFGIVLFVAGVLTYLATAAFAGSFGRVRWLGRGGSRAYVGANLIALLCLVMRGMSFPNPAALSTPWYTRPGFIAGIPAIPYIMPFLLGVVVLRRAGEKQP